MNQRMYPDLFLCHKAKGTNLSKGLQKSKQSYGGFWSPSYIMYTRAGGI
jgi:hypothetical protein